MNAIHSFVCILSFFYDVSTAAGCVWLQRWENSRAGEGGQGGSLLFLVLWWVTRDNTIKMLANLCSESHSACSWTVGRLRTFLARNKYLLRTIWILKSLMLDAVLLVIVLLQQLVSELGLLEVFFWSWQRIWRTDHLKAQALILPRRI